MEKLSTLYEWFAPAIKPDTILPAVIGAGSAIFAFVVGYVIQRALLSKSSEYQLDQTKKERSSLVAQLVSSWISKDYDRDKVNCLLFEASLWLPEKEAKELNSLFAHEDNAPTVNMVLESSRKIIHGKHDRMSKADFTIMPPHNKSLQGTN